MKSAFVFTALIVLLSVALFFHPDPAAAGPLGLLGARSGTCPSCQNGVCPTATPGAMPNSDAPRPAIPPVPVQPASVTPAVPAPAATAESCAACYRPIVSFRLRARLRGGCVQTEPRGEVDFNFGPYGFRWKRDSDWKRGDFGILPKRRACRR